MHLYRYFLYIYIAPIHFFTYMCTCTQAPCTSACTRLRPAEARKGSQVCVYPSAIHIRTYIYLFMYLYIFILTCVACTLPARERTGSPHTPPRGTEMLHGYFRTPGVESHRFTQTETKISRRGSPTFPGSIWGTYTPAGQPIDAHPLSLGVMPTHPGASRTQPRVQGGCCEKHPWFGPVIIAPEIHFPAPNQGLSLGMGVCIFAAHTRPPPVRQAAMDAATEADLVPKKTIIKGPIINEPSPA